MATTVYQYSLFCITENAFVTVWGTTTPTTCPNNVAHTIDTDSISIIRTISTEIVTTNESTLGNFQHYGVNISIPSGSPGDVTNTDLTWPMDLQVWKAEVLPHTENIGDIFNVIIAPDTPIGGLTANANIGDTVLNVSSTVFVFTGLTRGVEVKLNDGVNIFNCGRITAIDPIASTITVETALTIAFLAGTYFQISIYLVKNMNLHEASVRAIVSEKGFKYMPVPAGATIRLAYTNNDGNAKTMYGFMEYYYI